MLTHIVPLFTVRVIQCVRGGSVFARRIPAQIRAVRLAANRATPCSANLFKARTLRLMQSQVDISRVMQRRISLVRGDRRGTGTDLMPAAMKSIQEGLVQLPFEVRADCKCMCVCLRFAVCFCLSHFNMNALSSIDLYAHQSHALAFKGSTSNTSLSSA